MGNDRSRIYSVCFNLPLLIFSSLLWEAQQRRPEEAMPRIEQVIYRNTVPGTTVQGRYGKNHCVPPVVGPPEPARYHWVRDA